MNPLPIRPEDRCRSAAGDGPRRDEAGGAEDVATMPACFRSEAFVEDLAAGDAPAAAPAEQVAAASQPHDAGRPSVAAVRTRLGWAALFGLRPARAD